MKITNEELIKIAKEKAIELGRSPKRKEMIEYYNQIKVAYRTWGNFLAACNLSLNRMSYTKEDVVAMIQNVYKITGKVPTVKDIDTNPNMPDSSNIIRMFGTWNKLLEVAELEVVNVHPSYNYTDAELLIMLRKEIEKNQNTSFRKF